MAQRKILVDTCAYLRLAQSVHPLLGRPFGQDGSCLYVTTHLRDEYLTSQRIAQSFSWAREARYVENRSAVVSLSRRQRDQFWEVVYQMDDYATSTALSPSPVDLKALAVAYLAGLPLVTDDTDLALVAAEFEVATMGSIDLLDLMVKGGRITKNDAHSICDYLVAISDCPQQMRQKRTQYFGKPPPVAD